jgi:hypothetical protein
LKIKLAGDWFGIKMKAERLRMRLKADWLWTKLADWLGIKLAECLRIKLDVGWLPVKADVIFRIWGPIWMQTGFVIVILLRFKKIALGE